MEYANKIIEKGVEPKIDSPQKFQNKTNIILQVNNNTTKCKADLKT